MIHRMFGLRASAAKPVAGERAAETIVANKAATTRNCRDASDMKGMVKREVFTVETRWSASDVGRDER